MDKKKVKKNPSSKPSSAKRPTSNTKKSGKKGKKQIEPYVSRYPPIDYDILKQVPEVSLEISMELGKSCIKEKVPITTTFNRIIEIIGNHHCNACHNIRLYVIENSQRRYLDVLRFFTLKDFDIKTDQIYQLYYEYEPIAHPMLEAGLV
jgi:hypothetical protein